MRRHEYLRPLSREHHQTLRLARYLQRSDYDGRQLQYRLQGEAAALTHHFAEEETCFAGLVEGLPEGHPVEALLDRMHREHRTLSAMIDMLTAVGKSVDKTTYQMTCQTLGRLLAEHIAFEERSLFPALQDCCLVSESVHARRGHDS
ncbi:MAG: hemerythrin domain-containing protein [Halothiobacillus sp.]|jgi:hypothetical protein|nr:hemerythrin domain-containing protein [Halothiobacillus sp.]